MDVAPSVLVPSSEVDVHDPYKKQLLLATIARDVEESFITHPMRNTTQAEHKRRANICVMAFKRLRNEHRYSFDRACDNISRVLSAALDQTGFNASSRNGWFSRS